MQVLLEVIPMREIPLKAKGESDYEAFTIDSNWKAKDVFEAEYRKLLNPELVAKLEGFLEGSKVRRVLRAVFDRDIPFDSIDYHLECGDAGFTYRLTSYIAGKHSR